MFNRLDPIKFLRGTAAAWAANNPILLNGEPGFETDTGLLKIGNGVDDWATLSYVGSGGSVAWGGITGTLSSQSDLQSELDAKQDILVSGTDIKTVNGSSLLGSGDLSVSGSPFSEASLSADLGLTSAGYNDVTGLSFAVTSGKTYYFEANILFSTGTTTSGSAWSINGPASPTFLTYESKYTLTASTVTTNAHVTAYNTPATSNATSGSNGGNFAFIRGFIRPSASGTVIVRGQREVNPGTLTVYKGSFIRYRQID